MRETHFVTALRERGLKLNDLAGMLGVNKSTVSRWARKVPAERVMEVERVSGISRTELRPDLFPPDSSLPAPERAA